MQLEIEDTLAAGRIDQEWGEKSPGNYLALLMLFINLLYLFFLHVLLGGRRFLIQGELVYYPHIFATERTLWSDFYRRCFDNKKVQL